MESMRLLAERTSNSEVVRPLASRFNLIGLALIIVLAAISILVIRRWRREGGAYMGELERSNQELDDFAYIASHDLKEPLRGSFNHASFLAGRLRGQNR